MMSLLKKVEEKRRKEQESLFEAALDSDKKGRKFKKSTTRVYFIWGAYHTVDEIAHTLGLSRQYCYRKISEGYLSYLENYRRDSHQIKAIDAQKYQERLQKFMEEDED